MNVRSIITFIDVVVICIFDFFFHYNLARILNIVSSFTYLPTFVLCPLVPFLEYCIAHSICIRWNDVPWNMRIAIVIMRVRLFLHNQLSLHCVISRCDTLANVLMSCAEIGASFDTIHILVYCVIWQLFSCLETWLQYEYCVLLWY